MTPRLMSHRAYSDAPVLLWNNNGKPHSLTPRKTHRSPLTTPRFLSLKGQRRHRCCQTRGLKDKTQSHYPYQCKCKTAENKPLNRKAIFSSYSKSVLRVQSYTIIPIIKNTFAWTPHYRPWTLHILSCSDRRGHSSWWAIHREVSYEMTRPLLF